MATGNMKVEEPITQRQLELHRRSKWAERLLAQFIPSPYVWGRTSGTNWGTFWGTPGSGPSVSAAWPMKDSGKGFVAIPWAEADVRALLNSLAQEEVTPYKMQQVWNTLRWLSKAC